jgi:hypothetical protein
MINLRVWLCALYRGEDNSREWGTWEYKEITLPYGMAVLISDEMVASRALHHLWQERPDVDRVVLDWYGIKND